jgi:DNA polymerase-1
MYYPTSSGRLEQFMDYNIIYTNKEIHDYISGADVVAFDFETAPDDEWRDEPKAALDAHKAHIVGISLSVKEDSAVYIPLSHKVGANAIDPDWCDGILARSGV